MKDKIIQILNKFRSTPMPYSEPEWVADEIDKLYNDQWISVDDDLPKESRMYQCLGGYYFDGKDNWPHVKYWNNELKYWNDGIRFQKDRDFHIDGIWHSDR